MTRLRAVAIAVLTCLAVAPACADGHCPWGKRVAAAKRFAAARHGRISFAVVDEAGRLHGSHPDRVHNSASVVKVMFMVALLRSERHDALTREERHLLGPMIKRSHTRAANRVFERVGEPALYQLARDAGLDHFTTGPVWGLTTIAAGSQARFIDRIEHYVPRRHRAYAMRLLSRVIPRQRWGIPPVAPAGWHLYFKGGWSGAPSSRVNQVMLLRRPPRRRFSVAILTREQPSKRYGERSIQGVAGRLLAGYDGLMR